MGLEIKIPPVGESITEVTVATWHKEDGDYVALNEVICELESDKASFELNAEVAGILKITVPEGETVEIGATICHIAPSEGSLPAAEAAPPAQSSATSEPPKPTGEIIEVIVPTVGESINEVTISTWEKQSGDFVQIDDLLCEIESDKASFEFKAEHSGILEIVAQEGDTLEIGALICKIQVAEGGAAATPSAPTEAAPQAAATSGYASGHASPAAKKILQERGIDPATLKGTGAGGRITKDDALKAEKPAAKTAPKPAAPKTEAQPAFSEAERGETRKKLSSLRKTIARRLVAVKNDTAMLTTFNEIDMKPIMDIRKKYKEMFKEKHEVGLGFMSFFTRACASALQAWPAVNGMIDGEEIVYHNFVDISIAVSSPRGLVVPVIRNAEKLDFQGIEKEVVRLATRARNNKLTIPEMTGGTFTITNGGIFGSMMSTPIINAPQSAILGMHNIIQRPVVIDGKIEIRPMMYVALSYDHRIIDGRESVGFLVNVKQLLEDPIRLLLNV